MNALIPIFLCSCGAFFYLAGTVGLLRFPDTLSRLHALTKADNLGLGFVALGMGVASGSWLVTGKLLHIWVITMLGGTTNCYVMARAARQAGPVPNDSTAS